MFMKHKSQNFFFSYNTHIVSASANQDMKENNETNKPIKQLPYKLHHLAGIIMRDCKERRHRKPNSFKSLVFLKYSQTN